MTWETSEQLNIGLDARFLSGRLGFTLDWYNKKTKDLLVAVPVDPKVAGVEMFGKKAKFNTNMFTVPQAIYGYQPFLLCDSIAMIIKRL